VQIAEAHGVDFLSRETTLDQYRGGSPNLYNLFDLSVKSCRVLLRRRLRLLEEINNSSLKVD